MGLCEVWKTGCPRIVRDRMGICMAWMGFAFHGWEFGRWDGAVVGDCYQGLDGSVLPQTCT